MYGDGYIPYGIIPDEVAGVIGVPNGDPWYGERPKGDWPKAGTPNCGGAYPLWGVYRCGWWTDLLLGVVATYGSSAGVVGDSLDSLAVSGAGSSCCDDPL